MDRYIPDFVCLQKGLIVEIDGGIHLKQQEDDKLRTEDLETLGYTVIRFENKEVIGDVDSVIKKVQSTLNSLPERQHDEDEAAAKVPPSEGFREVIEIPIPLDENQLPLILPDVTSFKPTGDGRAPLANNADWVKNHYETDIMPGYAGSSWYFLRYMDPKNDQEFASKENIDYWQNVDVYFGGAEHAVGHLLYARMWHKFLYDLGYVKTDEPFKKLVNQGMIQGRSDFVYRMNYSYTETRLEGENTMGIDLPVIYVSKEYYDKNKSGTFDTLDTEKFNIAISEAKALSEKLGFSASGLKVNSNSISPINVEIELVAFGEKQERELILEEFVKHSRLGKNAILVLNDRGKYICGEDPEKMSKSKYNVINPDDVIEKHGADCFRMFEMFLGPIEQSKPWDDKGISGVSNFLKKFWRLYEPLIEGAGSPSPSEKGPEAEVAELKVLHKTLKKIADDIERLNFNTCISAFMIAANELSAMNCHKRDILELLLIALAPFAPFTTEELWERLGHKESIHLASYPKIEEKYLVEDSHTYGVSVNGKVRAEISLSLDITPQEAEHQVLALDAIKKWTNGNPPKKFIFVKGRIINVVV
ncbi:MAG: DUF559 domain-containing protein [Bacteroidetes bacterium]|nr:DUF559 domain-containing protein [Bacteroidota bacterium]